MLGSILCSSEDIKKKCILGNVAKNVWSRNAISLDCRLKIYDAQVASIILYNCNSWAAPNHALDHLDVTHCNHLRDMIGIKWPRGHISYDKLYEQCSTRCSLSERLYAARWKMLGHVLRYAQWIFCKKPCFREILWNTVKYSQTQKQKDRETEKAWVGGCLPFRLHSHI